MTTKDYKRDVTQLASGGGGGGGEEGEARF